MTDAPVDDILDLDAPSEEPEVPPFKFKFGGEVFTCRHPEELPVADLAEIIDEANSNPAVMLPVMLDPDELDRLERSESVFNLGDLRRAQEAWQTHYGLDAPKSSGSRRPSKSRRVR